jgi:hypothetical protein
VNFSMHPHQEQARPPRLSDTYHNGGTKLWTSNEPALPSSCFESLSGVMSMINIPQLCLSQCGQLPSGC